MENPVWKKGFVTTASLTDFLRALMTMTGSTVSPGQKHLFQNKTKGKSYNTFVSCHSIPFCPPRSWELPNAYSSYLVIYMKTRFFQGSRRPCAFWVIEIGRRVSARCIKLTLVFHLAECEEAGLLEFLLLYFPRCECDRKFYFKTIGWFVYLFTEGIVFIKKKKTASVLDIGYS